MGHEVIVDGRATKVKVCSNGHTYIDRCCPYCRMMPRQKEGQSPPRDWKEACERHLNKD